MMNVNAKPSTKKMKQHITISSDDQGDLVQECKATLHMHINQHGIPYQMNEAQNHRCRK